jgi:hypothetical protein
VPVTAACGSGAVGALGRCTRYSPTRSASSEKVASLVASTITRSGRRPSTTSPGAPGHGLRIRIHIAANLGAGAIRSQLG